jgi:ribosomal protein S18 acetylase RimI-like enzyme
VIDFDQMVTLVKMTDAELAEYLETSIQSLADELERANSWSPKQSMAASLQSFNALLPDRVVESPNQFLWTIFANGKTVGSLWFGIRGENEAVVWDILIHPSYRNRGYGKQAMIAMEQELRKLNVSSITLNVFAHNSTAFQMYVKLGYAPVMTRMSKMLR